MHPLIGRLIVNFVLCLICFIAYSSQIFIIWPWYGSALSVDLLKLLVPFNVLVGFLLWNYFLAVFTDPGRVPDAWKPDTHADGYEVKKLTGAPRYCRMCQKFKPPRTHHCRQCNRCVLRMDHHCPWINNCVGHFNHGHFIRFLFFVDLACSYHVTMVTKRVLSTVGGMYWDEPSSVELVMIIMNYVACIPVLLAVGGFSIYHFYSLLGNSTTIEGWEKDKVAVMVRKGKTREVTFPYDLGMRRNIESVLGPRPLLWCCPTRAPGTGLKYELSNKDGAPWPPKDSDSSYSNSSSTHNGNDDNTNTSSPWTYENGSLNPNLRPSNGQIQNSPRRRRIPGASSLPPYHPDYRPDDDQQATYEPSQILDEESSEGSIEENHAPDRANGHVRRGSEGYEIRPEGREEMLRRYLEEIGEEPDRYLRYIPQPDSVDSASDDDDVPLAQRREMIQQQ
ncbi:DHHC palmitoyltransferase-domain-containing protein [Crassisporium funariophilum]|nr:DHHC palmitoyltransferase-domain-containing protein [Crassisporium funariophilum]